MYMYMYIQCTCMYIHVYIYIYVHVLYMYMENHVHSTLSINRHKKQTWTANTYCGKHMYSARMAYIHVQYASKKRFQYRSIQYRSVYTKSHRNETATARTILRKRRLPFRFVLFRSSIDNRYSRLSEVS